MRFTLPLRPALLAAALLLSAPAALAQGNPGSGGPQPGQPTAVPIDGGASLLLAGGAAYALARLRRR
ncbi:PID-CTERM protein-sorting domain-containing protein [Hymenobacter sp. B81]|uniref:PID-CTERM protein-sorting domain-containing protein n=1 Tax=Hymenobacter sp. B81 TaxID=3344878 RepID=UPI0037DC1C18